MNLSVKRLIHFFPNLIWSLLKYSRPDDFESATNSKLGETK